MEIQQWKDRYFNRNDLSIRLTHLTKKTDDKEAFDVLLEILNSKKLIGGNGFIVGCNKAVCFQEAPMSAIAENIMFENILNKDQDKNINRYSMFGLRFAKTFIFRAGGRPVIYGKTPELKKLLPEDEFWRIVNLNLDSDEKLVDWTHEREWRIKGDLEFEYKDIEVVVPDYACYQKLVNYYIDKNRNFLEEVKGIITFASVLG